MRQVIDRPKAETAMTFSQPIRQIVTMMLITALVIVGAWAIHDQVAAIVRTNPLLNGLIGLVFLFGIATCFWQVLILMQSVSWIEDFARARPGHEAIAPPSLLAPLASLLRSRRGATISSSSSRSIQESVESRIEESRDITRYLINLLVFLGLLGTFWGLATTVPAVVETIRSLAPAEGESGLDVFGKLMTGLESQLGGMGTAFASSLLGLAGSLVVGLLELFAGHGQNRFVRELEEWLSSITRLGFSGEGEGGDTGQLGQVLEGLSAQVEQLQMIASDADASRVMMEERLGDLTTAIAALSDRLSQFGNSAALDRMAAGQERLLAELTGENSKAAIDAESRMRLRSIDVQLLRILEEMAAGREESLADLRADLSALTAAIRQNNRMTTGRG
ncbi:MAG: biopolymer transporter ExbB [Rhodobacteraceae bacterium]|nr:biopolymer transporter ExbB [Paracoccaceae bacterium]